MIKENFENYPQYKKDYILKLARELAEIVTRFSNFYNLDYYDLAVITQSLDISIKTELKKENSKRFN